MYLSQLALYQEKPTFFAIENGNVSIQEQRDKNNGVFIPAGFVPGKTNIFRIENGDVKIDTPDGKKTTS